ncbi:MAG: hypothetical protein KatS3mg096_879 [Candidatus Parcubacteria bacterium]|nr:MAG: hypothetical protein KatS3mg096_879 [Candidatus Parcubacteria bacterium]
MTPIYLSILFSIIFFITVKINKKYIDYQNDIFNPVNIITFLSFISTVPYLILVFLNPRVIQIDVYREIQNDFETAFLWFGIVYLVGFVSLIAGLRNKKINIIIRKYPKFIAKIDSRKLKTAIFSSFLIGIMSFILIISIIGGFSTIISNLTRRVELFAGYGYLMSLISLLMMGNYLLIYSLKFHSSKLKKIIILLLIVITGLILSFYGGRKLFIHLIIFSILVNHYCVKRYNSFSFNKVFIVFLFLIPYFIAMPLIRSSDNPYKYFLNINYLIQDIKENSESLITHLSYIDQYVFITHHFNISNYFYGSSFLDLFFAPIPSSIYKDKPPIDEGVYVRQIALGYQIKPPMPLQEIQNKRLSASWPVETLGNMYMNFGILGVIIGMYLLGLLIKLFYLNAKLVNFNLLPLLIYIYSVIGLQISNLRIVSFLITTIVLFFFIFLFFGIKKC